MTIQDFIKKKEEQFKKNNSINIKDIGRKGRHYFIREAWTFMPQHEREDKVFVIERLRKEKFGGKLAYRRAWRKGDIEYRIGYFIVGRIGKTAGKWLWGQYCPLIPKEDWDRLLAKAKKEKVII